MTRTTLTAGMKQALPATRETYRIGPRMRDVLLILSHGPWQGSLRALCRVIANECGVTWRSVVFSVKILVEMGLVEGPPYRLTPVGARYAARRLGPPARAPVEVSAPPRPLPPARLAISATAAPQRFAAPPGGWPAAATSIGPLRCPRCGNVVCMIPVPGTRRARCTVCGGEAAF